MAFAVSACNGGGGAQAQTGLAALEPGATDPTPGAESSTATGNSNQPIAVPIQPSPTITPAQTPVPTPVQSNDPASIPSANVVWALSMMERTFWPFSDKRDKFFIRFAFASQ